MRRSLLFHWAKNLDMIRAMRRPRPQDHVAHPLPARLHLYLERVWPRHEALRAIHVAHLVPLTRGLDYSCPHVKRPKHPRYLNEQLVARDDPAGADSSPKTEARIREVLEGGCVKAADVDYWLFAVDIFSKPALRLE